MEATKNICCIKSEGADDHGTRTRWFKKFGSHCKNLNDQARSGQPKIKYAKALLQAIEANLKNST